MSGLSKLLALAAPAALALVASLPIFSTFDADTPGSPPGTGGPDQPSSYTVPSGGSVLVQASAAGLTTQPVELYDDDGQYVTVDYSFPAVTDQVVRFEATMGVDQLLDAYILQTASSANAVLARLRIRPDGTITPYLQTTVLGNYQPNTPVRIRIDTDIVGYSYAVTVDEEMNGFGDNTTFPGLTFINSGLTDIGRALASINVLGTGAPATIAYDNIYVNYIDVGEAYCFGDGSGTPCPCTNNNNGSPGGCDWGSPTHPSGGVLEATGSRSMAANDTYLIATAIENNFGIFFGAANRVNGGAGNPLNDGLRCAGGGLVRLTPPTVATGHQAMTSQPIQALDTGAASGVTRRYQYWFRTPSGPCGQQANLTNGYEIVWVP